MKSFPQREGSSPQQRAQRERRYHAPTVGVSGRDHWEAVGGGYRSSWSTPAKDWLSRRELDFVRRWVPPGARRVLDVGIGNGRILEVLVDGAPSRRVFGIDLAQAMVEVCATRFAADDRIAGLAVCDVGEEPLPFEGPFDLITALRVLKYRSSWQEVVASLADRLSEDATLLFSMANRRSLNGVSRAYAVQWYATTVGELHELAARLGLTVGAVEGYGRLPFRLTELSHPAWLARSLRRCEVALARLLGPRLLARELLVAVTTHDRRTLRSAEGRAVVVDQSNATVEKRFLGELAPALTAAREEQAALLALRRVVAAIPGAACPQFIELLEGPPPTLRMQQVAGLPLLAFLRRARVDPAWLDAFGDVAAAVLAGYVAETARPYRDFQFDNLLYDGVTQTVGFIDLGAPDGDEVLGAAVLPLEASLGNLVGSVIFQSARPRWLLRRRQHRQAAQACAAVISRIAARYGAELSMDQLRQAAEMAFRRCAYRGVLQRVWYATLGFVVATRLDLLGNQFAPVLPTRRRNGRGRVPGGTKRK